MKSNTKVLIALTLVIIIDTMGVGLFFPVLSPLFMSTNGILPADSSLALRDSLYAVVFGIFCVCMFLSAPVIGNLSDRWGRKKVLLICLFGTALGALLCAFAIDFKSISLLILGRFLGGIFAGCQPIAQAAIIDISDNKNKTKNLSLIAVASCFGFVVGPIVGGYFSDSQILPWFNYATPFIADGILALINGILLIFTFQETYKVVAYKAFSWKEQISIYTDAIKHHNIFTLSLAYLSFEIAWALYFQFTAVYLVQGYAYTSRQIGIFMAFLGVIMGITFLGIIQIALRFFKEEKIFLYALLLSGISLFIPLIFKSQLGLWLSVIPISIGSGLAWGTALTLFSNQVSQEQQGWVMGIASSVASMAWIPGVLLTAALDYLDPQLPFFVSGILMLLGAGFFLWHKQSRKAFVQSPSVNA